MTVEQVQDLTELVKQIEDHELAVKHFEELIEASKKKGITSLNGHVTKYEAAIAEAIRLTLYHYKKELSSLQERLKNFGEELNEGSTVEECVTEGCNCADESKEEEQPEDLTISYKGLYVNLRKVAISSATGVPDL